MGLISISGGSNIIGVGSHWHGNFMPSLIREIISYWPFKLPKIVSKVFSLGQNDEHKPSRKGANFISDRKYPPLAKTDERNKLPPFPALAFMVLLIIYIFVTNNFRTPKSSTGIECCKAQFGQSFGLVETRVRPVWCKRQDNLPLVGKHATCCAAQTTDMSARAWMTKLSAHAFI